MYWWVLSMVGYYANSYNQILGLFKVAGNHAWWTADNFSIMVHNERFSYYGTQYKVYLNSSTADDLECHKCCTYFSWQISLFYWSSCSVAIE